MRTNAYYRLTLSALLLTTAYSLSAEAPDGYYDRAEGLNQGALLQALEDIVGSHTALSYGTLWNLYYESDVRDDGTIWDMYATTRFKPGVDQCGNASAIGDCYNREHSMPKSWFNDQAPMITDAFHIYPTDGKVNGQRSNYPFGECANGSYVASSGSIKPLGRLGRSTFPGYDGTVFEPDDEYKGDFARTYFYMAAAYNSRISSWQYEGARAQLAGNSYPCFSSWSVEMFMQWHREDPVSEKEINRNEVVYEWQHNRNPFIDHPELAEYIWGDRKGEGWVPGGGTTEPQITQPSQGEVVDLGITSVGQPVSTKVTIKGRNLTQNLTVSMTGDAGFTKSATTITAAEANEYPLYFTTKRPHHPEGLWLRTDSNRVTLSWGEVLGTQMYRLYRREAGTDEYTLIYEGRERHFTDQEAVGTRRAFHLPGTLDNRTTSGGGLRIYEYAVTAVNAHGESAKSPAENTDPASWRNWYPDTELKFKRRSAFWMPPYVPTDWMPEMYYPE